MPTVVGVRFREATKVYHFDPAGLTDLKAGDYVIVDTARGWEMGRIAVSPKEVPDHEIVGQLKKVLRQATSWDATQMAHFQSKEKEVIKRCEEKVREHHLPMKLIGAEYNYDGSRLVFFFTAEKRVDFRELVRDLARSFKTRIELRQVGVRDEAKLRGGIGPCGRELCCCTWLSDFNPVSIRMAKEQDMPLNPADISGICGRLLCCLAYENELYATVKRRLPRRKTVVDTPLGRGKVIGINVLKESLQVRLESEAVVEVPATDLISESPPEPRNDDPPPQRRKRGRRGKRQR